VRISLTYAILFQLKNMHWHLSLLHFLELWRPLGYTLLFFGMMVEGDIFLFSAAFLAQEGFFDVGDALTIALCGALLGDVVWYQLGLRLRLPFPWLTRFIERVTKHFDAHLKKRPFHTIFISKFTYGLHHLILFRAGALKLSFREYVSAAFPATFFWLFIVGTVGYVFGASFELLRHYLRFAELALLLALVLFFLLEHFVSTRTRKEL